MDEKTTTKNLLKRVEASESYISASLEKDIESGSCHYGRADIVFPDHNLAIEVKGERRRYKECIGQAIRYECGIDRAAIVLPEGNVSQSLFNAVCRAGVGLITVSKNLNLCIHHEPNGGWPFGYDNKIPLENRDRKKYEQKADIIIDKNVNWEEKL